MRPICEYCKRCQKKLVAIMGTICGYCKECCKNPTITMDRYAGTATNEECQQLFVTHMWVLQKMPKNQRQLWDLYVGIAY